jgi:hypothetical protein
MPRTKSSADHPELSFDNALTEAGVYTAFSFEAAWEQVIGPWLRWAKASAWTEALPTAVVTPTRAFGLFIRSRVIEAGMSLVAVEFWTPSDLRRYLSHQWGGLVLSREQMRLLLRARAEDALKQEPDNRLLRHIAADPDGVLRFWDGLQLCGADSAALRHPIGKFLSDVESHLRARGARTLPQLDFELREKSANAGPLLARVLLAGFDSSHWLDWAILSAGVRAAREATVCLGEADTEGGDLDMLWQGSWEETLGPSRTLHPPTADTSAKQKLDFLVAKNQVQEARAIVARIVELAPQPGVERVGVAFAGAGALAREVARLLSELEIPFNDSIGFLFPNQGEQPAWEAWLAFAEDPCVLTLRAFLQQASFGAASWWEKVTGQRDLLLNEFEKLLAAALEATLLDDLPLLARWMREEGGRESLAGEALACFEILPNQAGLIEFCQLAQKALTRLQLEPPLPFTQMRVNATAALLPARIQRVTFVRWLKEMTRTWSATREPVGNHSYSCIHLVTIEEAARQQWSHLMLTGQAEGIWPPRPENPPFLSGEESAELNRQITERGRREAVEGNQGEGHLTVREGRAAYLGRVERLWLQEKMWRSVRECARVEIAFSTHSEREDEPGKHLTPGEWFAMGYKLAYGVAPDDHALKTLAEKTAALAGRLPSQKINKAVARQTATAYRLRRECEVFTEYEFCLKEPPAEPLTLSCKDWEYAWKQPAQTWMRAFLGVRPLQESYTLEILNLTRGRWVHDWLARLGQRSGRWVARERIKLLAAHAANNAQEFQARMARLNTRTLPSWWLAFWREAAQCARVLGSACDQSKDWKHALTEQWLKKQNVTMDGQELSLHGRADLVLTKTDDISQISGDTMPNDVWVIDYKTGNSGKLDLKSANGLQVALYGALVAAMGAQEVNLSVLGAAGELKSETLEKLKSQVPWADLACMARSGRFGWYGRLRSEFRITAAYPLATLEVDPDILSAKWSAEHPQMKELYSHE